MFSLPVSGLPIFKLLDVTVSANTPLSGGAFGPEASVLLTPILLALVFAASRANNHPQASADLQSLRTTFAASGADDLTTENAMTASDEEREERENRFSTRMGRRKLELDEQTRQTLRLLNDARKPLASPEQSTPSPVSIPVTSEPELPIVSAPVSTPMEIAPPAKETAPVEVESVEAAPASPRTPPPEKSKPTAPRW